jgi:hypothetical protein
MGMQGETLGPSHELAKDPSMRALTAACLTGISLATTALITGCPGDNAPIPASQSPVSVSAVGLTQIKSNGATTNSIAVSWRGMPLGSAQIDLGRAVDDGASSRIKTFKDGETAYTDTDVEQGKSYQYSVTPFDTDGRKKVDATKSPAIRLATPSDLGASVLKSPANNTILSRSDENTFSWDAVSNADLYWLQVREATQDTTQAGKLVFAALTKDTSINIETASPIKAPASLESQLPTIKSGTQNGKFYKVTVTTLRTDPPGGDLATMRSLAMRDSASITFGVN